MDKTESATTPDRLKEELVDFWGEQAMKDRISALEREVEFYMGEAMKAQRELVEAKAALKAELRAAHEARAMAEALVISHEGRIEKLDKELAECRAKLAEAEARCEELAKKYTGDLAVELQRLGRQNERLREALRKSLQLIWEAPHEAEQLMKQALAGEVGDE